MKQYSYIISFKNADFKWGFPPFFCKNKMLWCLFRNTGRNLPEVGNIFRGIYLINMKHFLLSIFPYKPRKSFLFCGFLLQVLMLFFLNGSRGISLSPHSDIIVNIWRGVSSLIIESIWWQQHNNEKPFPLSLMRANHSTTHSWQISSSHFWFFLREPIVKTHCFHPLTSDSPLFQNY